MRRAISLIGLAFLGCDSSGEATEVDARVPPSRPPVATSPWTTEPVLAGGVGLQPALATHPNGSVSLAFFGARGVVTGPCDALGDAPPDQVTWDIHLATRTAAGWTSQIVAQPLLVGDPAGLALAYTPAGEAVLAVPSGAPNVGFRYCGANDLALLRAASAFAPEVVVSESAQAASGLPASDFGTVVGVWPALAFAPDGSAAVAWKDVHAGSIQRDDLARADLELARGAAGGWAYTAVDAGRGHGDHTAIAFDPDGRLVIADENPVEETEDRLGVWVRREAADGFEAVRLSELPGGSRPGLAFEASGAVWVSFHDAAGGRPMVAYLADPTAFADLSAWTFEAVGDARYREGRGVQVAVSPQGFPSLVWYRCGRVGEVECRADQDGVVFAWRADGEWMREVVEAGGDAPCGQDPQLAYDADSRAWVAWRCNRPAGDGFESVVEAARRSVLR